MAGIPFHSYQIYALKLLEKGYKVAIVEQVEDPALAKGLVKRDVIKILTPGTTIDTEINSKKNNYIVSISPIKREYALANIGRFFFILVQAAGEMQSPPVTFQDNDIRCRDLF